MSWTAAQKRYAKSDKGREARKRYLSSEKYKETHRLYLIKKSQQANP